ncbi:fungal-specific transcription factor domain-containing protein [Roridomyces roridus]|uniref:Fungal-specific transcription factor domain-containing protein n=1 Tax=Roridomyces roridus TaxID=1738132 RepID=A0AAD7CGC0_9AGAR|nr:fungal-specific transcription factor domain-containing protein [Roridomyces roridus]
MPSESSSLASSSSSVKTRRPRPIRSCDACRERKGRILRDGPSMPGSNCSACLTAGAKPCTYVHPPGKPGPRNKVVQELKQKIAMLEAKLRALSVCSLCSQPLQSTLGTNTSGSNDSEIEPAATPDSAEPVEEDGAEELTLRFRQWKLSTLSTQSAPKFFGSASYINLVQSTLAVKQEYLGRPLKPNPGLRRPLYWEQFPWEKELYTKRPVYSYPPDDLLNDLVELYFINLHPVFPVLHRNSFQRMVVEGLHREDPSFGAVLLAVLALASRYSDDPRVMIEGNQLSSGWPFVSQVPIVTNVFEPTVYDVQFYCLMTLFSVGGSTAHILWVYMGLAVRFVQFHGPYLRRRDGHKFEDELWNRAFWSVFLLDIWLSTYIGRPPAIHAEEYDVDPPLEVDDEYWENGFVQPPDKPSALSFFVQLVRVSEILANALGRLYAPKRLKTRKGWTTEHEKEAVAELDSLLNHFLDTIPAHLRWGSPGLQGVSFQQSATLYCTYYWVHLTIHRPYMQNKTPLAGTSLFICVTAARSALTVADVWAKQSHCVPPPFLQVWNAVFMSAVILVLNIFATKRAGVARDVEKDLAQIQTATNIFKKYEARSQGAGRIWELLQELQSMDEYLSLRAPVPSASQTMTDFHRADPLPVPQNLGLEWSELSSDVQQPGFPPGTSIEQLLSETDTSSNAGWNQPLDMLDNLWFADPAELMNVDQWDAYIDNMTVADGDWFNTI